MFNLVKSIVVPGNAILEGDDGEGSPNQIVSLAMNDNHIATSLIDSTVYVFSTIDGTHLLSLTDPCGQTIWGLAVIDELVVIGSGDGILRVYKISNGSFLHEIRPPISEPKPVQASEGPSTDDPNTGLSPLRRIVTVRSSSHPESILAGTSNGQIRLWRPDNGGNYTHSFLGGHQRRAFDTIAYEDGQAFISVSWEGSVCAWDLESGKQRWRRQASDTDVFSAVVKDETVLVGRKDGTVLVLGLEDGHELGRFEAHTHLINGLLVRQDRLITTGTDGLAKIWTASAAEVGKVPYTLKRSVRMHDKSSVARVMLGDWLVTAGKEGGPVEDVCGLNNAVKAVRVAGEKVKHGADEDQEGEGAPVTELGMPVVIAGRLAASEKRRRVVVGLQKRGKPTLDIWEYQDEDSK